MSCFGDICDLKYQIGNLKEYPIRYKCNCGVTIKGNYIDGRITMKNAKLVEEQLPQFVVMILGEFLTRVPYSVTSMEEIRTGITAFIEATQHIDYFEYRNRLEKLINYRDYRLNYKFSQMTKGFSLHLSQIKERIIKWYNKRVLKK